MINDHLSLLSSSYYLLVTINPSYKHIYIYTTKNTKKRNNLKNKNKSVRVKNEQECTSNIISDKYYESRCSN